MLFAMLPFSVLFVPFYPPNSASNSSKTSPPSLTSSRYSFVISLIINSHHFPSSRCNISSPRGVACQISSTSQSSWMSHRICAALAKYRRLSVTRYRTDVSVWKRVIKPNGRREKWVTALWMMHNLVPVRSVWRKDSVVGAGNGGSDVSN